MNAKKLNAEYKKISKRYYELEDVEFRTSEQENEIDAIEIRMAEIANLLENI